MPWPLSDIVDFECLLDRRGDEQAADVPAVAALRGKGVTDRREIFAAWVENERDKLGTPTPGRSFENGMHLAGWVAGVAGLLVGGSLCAGLLLYRGDKPVNVGLFLPVTVGVQVLFLMLTLSFCLCFKRRGLEPVRALWGSVARAFGAGFNHLPGKQRMAARAVLATLSERRDLYGGVLIWPTVVVAQVFGVCFNLGLLAVLLLRVAVMDLAFGWESTMDASADDVHRIISTLALPWSWLPSAYPDLAQISSTQFKYATGIKDMNTNAMRAWWPFAAYAIAFYGLLPRMILLAWAYSRGNRARAVLGFDHAKCNELFRRLMPPLAVSGPAGPELEIPSHQISVIPSSGSCWILVSEELTVSDVEIKSQVSRACGWSTGALHRMEIDNPLGNQHVLNALRGANGLAGVVVVVAAYHPPIVGMARTLAAIRVALGFAGGGEILLLLVGRDHSAMDAEALDHWRKFNAIHKLGCSIAKWKP